MCDATTRATPGRTDGRIGPRPRWGLLYGCCAGLTLAWLAATEMLVAPGPARTVVRCGLALATIGVLTLWVRLNGIALDQEAWCECAASTISVRVIRSRRPAPSEELVVQRERERVLPVRRRPAVVLDTERLAAADTLRIGEVLET